MSKSLRATALILMFTLCGAALASDPASLVKAAIPHNPGVMPGEDISLFAVLTNTYDEPVDVTFDNFAPPATDEAPVLFVWPPAVRIPAQTSATIEIVGRARAAGKFVFIVRGAVHDGIGSWKPELTLPLYLRVEEDGRAANLTVRLEDYSSLFDEELEEHEGIGKAFPVEEGLGGIVRPEEPILLPEEPEDAPASAMRRPQTDATLVTVKGQYRWKDSKGTIQPAAGWRAALYRFSDGKWIDTGARATVQNDASFTLKTSLAQGTPARVVLYPSNRYFDMVDGKGDKYQFVFHSFATEASSYDYGPWWIDLNKTVPGLGELHRSAYALYSKFTSVGFSPLRSKPIKIIYPGTNDCGSCSTDGSIHIEVAKAANNRTIKHELGHELMDEYWGSNPGNGGYHEWDKCASKGLALSEGFAHFISWWANVDRGTLAGSWGTDNGESLPGSVCKDIGTNELRVAATFWDLHDTHVDGVDLYTNAGEGRILEMILGGRAKRNSYIELMYPRLEAEGGLEYWRIAPISEMNFTK